MNFILSLIIILIIILFIILIINRKYYFSEDFVGSYDQNTIEDFIPITYIPSNPYLKEELTEYDIIDIYKKILDRSPNMEEIKIKIFQNKEDLIEELYNSYEYEKLTKVQDNLAENGIESSIAKRNLLKKIIDIYKKKYKKDPDDKILMPLRDCYIHLRNNIFLFKALIEADNYIKFENEILTTITITKKNLLDIFNKYYNLLELKLKAEEIIKNTKGGNDEINDNIDVETLKKELAKITKDTIPESSSNLEKPTITANVDEVKNYLNQQQNLNINESFNNENKISPFIKKYIDNIINNKNSSNIINESFENENGDISLTIKRYIDNAIASNPTMKYINNSINQMDENKEINKSNEIRKITSELPENSEVYVRVYNPIDYKQQSYIGDARFRPPICTSLGQKSLEQPIFTNSKLLFQGAELDKAFEETQVGSIMPKFIYKEYQDVRIK